MDLQKMQNEVAINKLLSNSHDGIFVVDLNATILEWNPVLENITRIPKNEAINASLFNLIPDFKVLWEYYDLPNNIANEDLNIYNQSLALDHETPSALFDLTFTFFDTHKTKIICFLNEKQLRKFFELSNEGIGIVENYMLVDFNQKLADLFGYEPEELYGTKVTDLTEKDTKAKVEASIDQDYPEFYYGTGIRKDGTQFYVKIHGKVQTINGKKQRIAFISDISDQQKVEQELKDSEHKFRILSEKSHVGVYLFQDNEFKYVNPELARILSYQPEEIIQNFNTLDFVHPDDQEKFKTEVQKRIDGEKETSEYELRIIDRFGNIRYVEARGSVIEFEGKKSIMGTLLDITERKKREETLKINENLFRQLFQNAPIGIVMLDTNNKVLEVNQSFEQYFGFTETELLDKNIDEVIIPDELHKEATNITQKIHKGEFHVTETIRERKDGTQINVLIYGVPVVVEGNQTNIYGIYVDITDQKKTKQALIESEETFSKVFHAAPNSIAIARIKDGVLLDVNESFCKLSGFSRDEVIGASASEFDFWVNSDQSKDLIQKMQTSYQVRSHEAQVYTNQGTIRDIYLSVEKITIGGEACFVTISNDITEQKKAQRQLIREKEFTDQLVNSLPGVFYLLDKNHNLVQWNSRLQEVSGFSDQELNGVNPTDFFAENEKSHILKNIEMVFEAGYSVTEAHLLTKQGNKIPFLLTGYLFKSDGREYLLGMGIDITSQKETQRELHKNEILFRQLFQNAPVGIVMLDEEKNIYHANHGFEKLFQYEEQEIKGSNIDNLIVPENLKAEAVSLSSQTYTGKPLIQETNRQRKDGSLVPVLIYGVPVHLEGKTISIYGIYVDISERKQIEEDLKKRTEQLLRTNAELEQFAYVTSHNLRAPVVNLKSLLDLYHNDQISEEEKGDVFQKIDTSVNQLNATLNDIIHILALKDEVSNPKASVEFKEMLDKVKGQLGTKIEESGAQIHADFAKAPSVTYIRSYLESIFQNLISNAIKFKATDRPPKIFIQTSHEDGYILLKIQENGMGMDLTKHKDKLFDMYKRFHTNIEGKGLGMYIVKTQVDALGGWIDVESEIDQGTTFYIYLKDFSK
ncbi:MAG: hypothetical protein BRD49_02840 [Bacteroidetes bacterium SW_10_40_5]|nr:MAG: hypothetical protein BRD49_02840 [Bacteroidetes bacterium SW_10_40_5]